MSPAADRGVERWELRIDDPDYPPLLALSPKPPAVLYGMGDPSALTAGLGVVGARRATPYGRACARKFAGWAASNGITIYSGAAIGCDQAAHLAALESGGRTVAVLGCGADVDYPSGARRLLDRIRSGGGAVVSEQPWGNPPLRWAFRERNRIIAGLTSCLLVVEAGLPSGTFSTADFALEAGRDVLAVPGSIFAPECRGPNRLIRQGATAVTDISEFAESLTGAGLQVQSPAERVAGSPLGGSDRLLAALLADPSRPDDLAREFDQDIVTVMRQLTRLETAGLIARYPDGRYGPC